MGNLKNTQRHSEQGIEGAGRYQKLNSSSDTPKLRQLESGLFLQGRESWVDIDNPFP